MSILTGIHHITAIAGDAQENLDFYAGVLGMRLVKRSVNQDVPDTYHLFYADADGHPGADLTFFPWPAMGPGRVGTGLGVEIALAVPAGSLDWWRDRLRQFGVSSGAPESRHGERVLPVTDPHGLALALVETADARAFTAWDRSSVPAERQIRGLHALRLWERDLSRTARFLTDVLGFSAMESEGEWHRFGLGDGGSGKHVDVRELPSEARGNWGTGTMHHVAWRVPDDAAQADVRARVVAGHARPTEVIDRFWFRSVYFREPGGVLFEVATDGPGFTADEDLASLGERLVLPPWLEPHREEIEGTLPRLEAPDAARARASAAR